MNEDIHRFISSTELFLSDIKGLRYTGLKKVNFFVGHPVCDTMAGSFVNFSLLVALTSIWSTTGTFNYCYRHTFHNKINISNISQIIKCLVQQKICVLSSCSPVSHYLILTLCTMSPPCARFARRMNLPRSIPPTQDEEEEEQEV